MDVPGHTAGHIAYYAELGSDPPVLFCGDTLFSAGCGRLFEGTALQLQASLRTLTALPGETRVCCAHEYTLGNLKFAREVDPENPQLKAYQLRCQALRAEGRPTLPSSLETELQINPFLRTDQPMVLASARRYDSTGTAQYGAFATLRQWKNNYQ